MKSRILIHKHFQFIEPFLERQSPFYRVGLAVLHILLNLYVKLKIKKIGTQSTFFLFSILSDRM